MKIVVEKSHKSYAPEDAPSGTAWLVRNDSEKLKIVEQVVVKIHNRLYISLGNDAFYCSTGWNDRWNDRWHVIHQFRKGEKFTVEITQG